MNAGILRQCKNITFPFPLTIVLFFFCECKKVVKVIQKGLDLQEMKLFT
jgi:hypothetical protein